MDIKVEPNGQPGHFVIYDEDDKSKIIAHIWDLDGDKPTITTIGATVQQTYDILEWINQQRKFSGAD